MKYDVILIGTGPPMLFEGLAIAEAGKKVIFVDQAAELGGAWRTPTVFGYRNVETGVHIIENRRHLLRLLETLLGPGALIKDPLDFGLVLKRRIPMRVARVLLYALAASKALLRIDLDRSIHGAKNTMSAIGSLTVPLVYPVNGFAGVLAALHERLCRVGAEFRFGTQIKSIRIDHDRVTAGTNFGDLFSSNLVMSSRAHAPIEGLEHLWRMTQSKTVPSVVLHLGAGRVRFDGYVEIFADPFVKRVRNITRFVSPAPAQGTALVTVQLRGPHTGTDDITLAGEIIERLQKLGLLAGGVTAAEVARKDVSVTTSSRSALAQIGRTFPDRVTLLNTVDLSDRRHRVAQCDGAAENQRQRHTILRKPHVCL